MRLECLECFTNTKTISNYVLYTNMYWHWRQTRDETRAKQRRKNGRDIVAYMPQWFGTVWCAMPALSVTTTALNIVCMLAIVICASATNKNSSNGSDVQPTQELSLYLGDIHRF